MTNAIEIEDIDEMRRQVGIEDVELRAAIRYLTTGDCVRLTFKTDAGRGATAPVVITKVCRHSTFRGKLMSRALKMPPGTSVEFTVAHIHSIVGQGYATNE